MAPLNCSYIISGTTYNGCLFAISNSGWLTQMNITDLGTSTIGVNKTIAISLQLTNGWNDQVFTTAALQFYISSQDNTYLSHGILGVNTLNGANSFTPVSVNNLKTTQSSTQAGAANTVTVSFDLTVPTPSGATVKV